MVTNVDRIIGRILSRQILSKYAETIELKQIIRVMDFLPPEVYCTIDSIINKCAEDGVTQPIIRIASKDINNTEIFKNLDNSYFLSEESLTTFRNVNDSNQYLFFEMEEQSDEQGLAYVYSIRDSNLLIDENDKYYFEQVIEEVWKEFHKERRLPGKLKDVFVSLMNSLHPVTTSFPLRKIATFTLKLVDGINYSELINNNKAWEIVLSAVTTLGMFPDKEAASMRDSAILTRIKKNYFAASMMKPNGSSIDAEMLALKALSTIFVDATGSALENPELKEMQALCSEYCSTNDSELLKRIPWFIFSQLLASKKTEKIKLGDLVEDEVGNKDDLRLDELCKLDVCEGLNRNQPESARTLIVATPDDLEEIKLFDILELSTQKKVHKLAEKSESIDNFLPWLLEEIHNDISDLKIKENAQYAVTLKIPENYNAQSDFTSRLFSFLHLNLLRYLKDQTEDLPISFLFSDHLAEIKPLTLDEISDLGEKEEGDVEPWGKLPLELTVTESEGNTSNIVSEKYVQWEPRGIQYLAFFFLTACDVNLQKYHGFEQSSEEDIATSISSLINSGFITAHNDTIVGSNPHDEWISKRHEYLKELNKNGLSIESCESYFNAWTEILKIARNEFKLDGSANKAFTQFMLQDTISNDNEVILLPSHPFRARWIAAYLRKMQEMLLKSMRQELEIVKANESFIFNMLKNLSPHQHPPYFVKHGGKVFNSVEESGYAEKYLPFEHEQDNSAEDWTTTLDDKAIETIVEECKKFLEFHPYKNSLDILIPAYGATDFVEKFILKFFDNKALKKEISLRLHIVAPFGTLKNANFVNDDTKHLIEENNDRFSLPRVQLIMYPWNDTTFLPDSIKNDFMDIAIVPNLFVKKLRILDILESMEPETEAYDVLLSRSTRRVINGRQMLNVKIDMLPNNDDETLHDWAALNVLLKRLQPLAPGTESKEHLQLQIDISESEGFFNMLHEVALWVITLDNYLSKKNIEALPNKPEIITFKDRIGKNAIYNLVVSSKMGESFVVPRLKKKITERFGLQIEKTHIDDIARSIYEECCELSPGIILRSLGGGWTINEIIGLVCSKRYLILTDTSSNHNLLLDAFISLDEHKEWFAGRNNQKRADFLRVKIMEDDLGKRNLELTVVESKMGSAALAENGIVQVKNTLDLIREAFTSKGNEQDDGRIWRESLLNAIENSSLYFGSSVNDIQGTKDISDSIRGLICTGEYETITWRGTVICHVLDSDQGSNKKVNDINICYQSKSTVVKLLMGESLQEATQTVPKPQDDKEIHKPKEVVPVRQETATSMDLESVGFNQYSNLEKNEMYQMLLDRFDEIEIKVDMPEEDKDKVIEGPSFLRLKLLPSAGTKIKQIKSSVDEIHSALKLLSEDEVRIFQDGGFLWIEIPKPSEKRSMVSTEHIWNLYKHQSGNREGLMLPIGVDMAGGLVEIHFSSSNSPHLLIGGTTGSGKSVALNTLLYGAIKLYTPNQLKLFLVDPKEVELADFEGAEHLGGEIGSTPSEAIDLLESAVEEMHFRYKMFREQKKTVGKVAKDIREYNLRADENLPRWLLVLDEYADLVSDKEDKHTIEQLIQRLCQKARAAGIHVILATQKPLVNILSSAIKANLPAILALKVKNSTDSKVLMDEPGAEALAGKGDALFKDGAGRVARLQCAAMDSD